MRLGVLLFFEGWGSQNVMFLIFYKKILLANGEN